MINVGLIGFGFGGRVFHAPIISAVEGMRLAAVLQRSASDAAELYPEARVVRSVEEMLSIPEIELIVVTTPNQTHFPIAKQCLERGRNVVIDKPFTVTWREARDLAQLAKAQGKVLSVYQNRRWDGDFQTVQKLIREGTLGRIVLFESHYERFRPQLRPGAWRERDEPGAGILFDLGPHLLDQALVLFGTPEAVFADVRTERDGSLVDDAFDVTFFYPRMRAMLRSSMLVSAPGARLVLQGDRGSFVKHGMDPQEEALKQGEKPHGEAWGRENEEDAGTLVLADGGSRRVPSFAGDYRGYYENVRDAILGKARLAVTPEQGIDVIIALELARESSRTGKRIPWPAK
ncbi:MAG: oxidoreductase [Acidobacteriaceae bacterium]